MISQPKSANPFDNITPLFPDKNRETDPRKGGTGDGGDNMLERIKKLEDKIVTISTDMAIIKATMCTKEDLHKEMNGQTWKIIIALIVTVLIAVFSRYFIK